MLTYCMFRPIQPPILSGREMNSSLRPIGGEGLVWLIRVVLRLALILHQSTERGDFGVGTQVRIDAAYRQITLDLVITTITIIIITCTDLSMLNSTAKALVLYTS